MNILILEPYMTGSHAVWARGYQKHSNHQVRILSLEGQYWKWRMHGGSVELARQFNKIDKNPDLILATDMMDLTTFLALTRNRSTSIPVALYFHENQLCYPWSPEDRDLRYQRDHHYGFINYVSSLAADAVFFNSGYHRESFIGALSKFLNRFPDYRGLETVKLIAGKSKVLYLGLDLGRFEAYKKIPSGYNRKPPLILWNHRWEYDKNPEDFFQTLELIIKEGLEFEIVVLGENFSQKPDIFEKFENRYNHRIVQFGFVDSFADYAKWLWKADIIPVTSIHEFFGISVVEAIHCNCYPILPERLSYPEFIPVKENSYIFYKSQKDLMIKLKHAIMNIDTIRSSDYSEYVAKYDWSYMASQYDKTLASVVSLMH